MHAFLVENYGLNTKHIFLIMVVLYRVLSLECNVFKLIPYKDRTMCALTRSFKLRTYSHSALISSNRTVIQGVSLECNMFKLVACKERTMRVDTFTNYELNTMLHYVIIMATLHIVLSLECNVFKIVSCKQTTMGTLTFRF